MDLVATNQSKSSGDVVVELEYEIEEDVEAELEEFVRLSHTGQFKDAHELFDECLSSYDDWYPVAAEYADCLLRQGDFERLAAFSEKASRNFKDPQENLLLELMLLIASLLPRDATRRRLKDLLPDLSLKPPYTSLRDTDIHLLEIVLQILVFSRLRFVNHEDFDDSISPEFTSVRRRSVFKEWFYYLLCHEYFWEAQRILHSLFHELPWLECWIMVQDYLATALRAKIGQESVKIAVSSMIQRFIYVFKSANPNPLAVVEWNDAITWALFGVTLAKADANHPSLFSHVCLRRSLQEELGFNEPLPWGGITNDPEFSVIAIAVETHGIGDIGLMEALIASPSHYTLDELNDWVFASAALTYSQKDLSFFSPQQVRSRDGYLRTPLHWASLIGEGNAVETLLDIEETDAGLIDWFGCTALHYAVGSCVPGSETEGLRIVKALLKSDSASVNTRDPSGLTPLYMAIVNRSYDVADILLQHNAIVETCDYGALLLLGENNVDWLSKWKLLLSKYDHPQASLLDNSSSEFRDYFTLDFVASMYKKASRSYPGTIDLDTDEALVIRSIPPQTVRHKALQTLLSFLLENGFSGTAFPIFQRDQDYLNDTAGIQTLTGAEAASQRLFSIMAEVGKVAI